MLPTFGCGRIGYDAIRNQDGGGADGGGVDGGGVDGGGVDASRDGSTPEDSAAIDGSSDAGFDAGLGLDAGSDGGLPSAGYVRISAGIDHTCALDIDGRAFCWGSDGHGRLGENDDGNNEPQPAPTLVETDHLPTATFTSVSAGQFHSCGTLSNQSALCWGRDNNGQLGDSFLASDSDIAVAVNLSALAPAEHFIVIEGNFGHSCGLTNIGGLYCWGLDLSGQLGEDADGDNANEPIPVAVEMSPLSGEAFRSISVGSTTSCGIATNFHAYCWGSDGSGQLGEAADGDNLDEPIPVAVERGALGPGELFTQIDAAANHTCAVTSDGNAFCWGSNEDAALGNGGGANKFSPVPVSRTNVPAGVDFVSVSTGRNHSCAVMTDGSAYCWGEDADGQLGNDGGNPPAPVPVPVFMNNVTSGARFIAISAGGRHTCALADNGEAYCWGRNTSGQLGIGVSGPDRNLPQQVLPPP